MSETEASEWQQRISGEWYGLPSVFDAEGSHTGFNKVSRASVFADGKVTYQARVPPSGSLVCGMMFRLQEHYQEGVLVLLCASLTTLETWPSQVEGASLLRK